MLLYNELFPLPVPFGRHSMATSCLRPEPHFDEEALETFLASVVSMAMERKLMSESAITNAQEFHRSWRQRLPVWAQSGSHMHLPHTYERHQHVSSID